MRKISLLVLAIMCIGMVVGFFYLYLSTNELVCYQAFVYLSVIWLGGELAIIVGLYRSSQVSKVLSDLITLMIAISNVWFGLFVFGLNACG